MSESFLAKPKEIKSTLMSMKLPIEMLKKLKVKGNVSGYIKTLINRDMSNSEDKVLVSGDWKSILTILENSPSLIVYGNVGSGKSFTINELIKNDKGHKYILLNAHKEDVYELPIKDTIFDNPESSYMIQLPKEVSASKGIFPVYLNQLLSKKWNDNLILVIEEANRYKDVKALLRESRKFVKVLGVAQERICNYVPHIKILKKEDIGRGV
jgi:hypothetical protein